MKLGSAQTKEKKKKLGSAQKHTRYNPALATNIPFQSSYRECTHIPFAVQLLVGSAQTYPLQKQKQERNKKLGSAQTASLANRLDCGHTLCSPALGGQSQSALRRSRLLAQSSFQEFPTRPDPLLGGSSPK